MCCHTHNVVIYSKFHPSPFRGFRAPGDQNLPFPISFVIGLFNSLYYPTSHDFDVKFLIAIRRHISAYKCMKFYATGMRVWDGP